MKARDVFPGVFSRHAAAYRDRLVTPMATGEARGRLLVLELLAVRPGERVLDVACGPGTLTYPLADAAGSKGLVVGTDLAEGMLRLAREDAPASVVLARMDSERLGLRDAAFDAVACGHGLQFCPDLGAALKGMQRVLRSPGRFAASVPAGQANRQARSMLDEVFAELPPPPEVPERAATLEVLSDPERVRVALLQAGFTAPEVTRVEETIRYANSDDLIARTFGWWECAWRLESIPAEERSRLRANAAEKLRRKLGEGPVSLPGLSHVLFARK
jgi:ubiquinone/menaquinone biosynthesis C-methylase UbiE